MTPNQYLKSLFFMLLPDAYASQGKQINTAHIFIKTVANSTKGKKIQQSEEK
jgi:hypothetical protein